MHALPFAFRQFLKHPGFSVVAVLTLALGIGANTAVFTVVNATLLRPLPWPDSHRVMSLWEGSQAKGHARAPVAPAQFLDLRRDARTFHALAGWNVSAINLAAEGGTPERYQGASVTEDFFRVVGVLPQQGSGFQSTHFTPGSDDVVVLSDGIWRERFGGAEGILGRTIQINGRARTVVGVMPPGFQTPAKARFWTPRIFSPFELQDRDFKALMVLGRLADGVTVEQARTELKTLFASLCDQFPDVLTGWDVSCHPALEDVVGPLRPTMFTLMAAVAVVLLLACLNVANLVLARGAQRQSECSVRAALGADQGALLRQLLIENLVLTAIGGVVGVLVAHGLLSGLLALAPAHLPRLDQVRMDAAAFGFTGGACIFTGMLFGILPAWTTSRAGPMSALSGTGRRATASVGWLRRGLVVIQVGAAMAVLVATGLLLRSLDRLLQQDLGFNPAHLMTARLELPPRKYGAGRKRDQFAEEVLRRLSEAMAVESAAASTFLPLQGWPQYIMRLEENAGIRVSDAPTTGYQGVSPEYFETMEMTVLRGRSFSIDDDEQARRVAVVNQTFARRFFGDRDPLGRRFEVGFSDPPEWLEIVGVVSDCKGPSLESQPDEQVFVPLRQQAAFLRDDPALSLVIRGRGDVTRLGEAIRSAVWAADRDQPVHLLKPMTEVVREQAAQRRFAVTVLSVFAGAAMLLAVLGLYGVMGSGVAARTQELGVRLALGSTRGGLLRLVLRDGARLTTIGMGLGVFGAIAVTRLLRSLLFEIEPLDPVTYLAVPTLLASVAMIACWIPAWRAAQLEAAVALRSE